MSDESSNEKQIPPNWLWVKIREVGDVVSGGTPSTSESSYWGNDINWLSPADLTGHGAKYIKRGAKSLTQLGLIKSSAKLMPAGSVHFSSRAPIGYIAISKEDISTNQGFKSLVPATGIFNEYVYYYFKSIKHYANSIATGTTFKELSGSAFGGMPFPFAPTKEQHRIVAKIEELFSEIDKGVESLKTAKAQLQVYRQALLKHAFEGKLTAQWRSNNPDKVVPATELLRSIDQAREERYHQQLTDWQTAVEKWEFNGKDGKSPSKPNKSVHIANISDERLEDHEELPCGWIYLRAEDISEFITKGTTPSKDRLFSGSGDIPFIKVYNLTKNGRLDFSIDPTFTDRETHNYSLARSKVYSGDALMNIVGPPLGKVSIVPRTYEEWNINQAIVRFRSYFLDSRYLANYLLAEQTVRTMSRKAKATVGQFNLTLEICRDVLIPVCGQQEQEEILKLIDANLTQAEVVDNDINRAIKQSEVLRQSILKKAFSGQLVPQDPNDEPASELLKRIQTEKVDREITTKTKRKSTK